MRKFGRKNLSALLALALLVSLLPLGAAPAQAGPVTLEGAGTADDPYLIEDEVDLAQFAMIVSGNSGYVSNPNACAKLTANINLRVPSWQPIGTCEAHKEEPIVFNGTFDGNSHTISGNIDNMGDEYQSSTDVGLFARLGSGGTVKNLKVTGSVSGEMGVNVGGIVGANNGGSVTNCTFVSGGVSGGIATNVGGIVGQNGIGGSVTDCTFSSGSLSGNGNVGGIVGQNDIGGSVTDCTFSSGSLSGNGNVGGIVGQNNSSVTDCSNNGGFSISGSGNNFGGVVGNNSGTVENCSNSGSFSVPAPGAGSDTSGGNLGGVVGQNSGAGARITSCYNTGDLLNYTDPHPKVFFNGNLGGVVGNNTDNSSVTNCYSTGNIGSNDKPFPVQGIFGGVVGNDSGNSSVTNCYNTGKFGKYIDGTVGGVVGSNVDTSSVTGCYNSGNVSGTQSNTVGGVVGNNGADSNVTGCYFLKTDTVNAGQVGIGYGANETDSAIDKDDNAFHSGEVAWLLESEQSVEQIEPVWGQNNLKAETSLPALIALDDSAETVYQVTVNYGDYADAPPDQISYTNTVTAPTTVPTRDDYIFVDWQMTEGEGNTITFTPQWRNSLGITAPIFESVTEGYAQPAAQPLTITNSGNIAGNISSVALSGTNAGAFSLNKTDGATIAAGATDNTTYTIQPAADLSTGTYEATVTVTYSESITVTTIVSFTVQPAPEPEPTPEPDPTPTPTPDPEPTPEGPSTEGSAGWEDIAGEIEDAEEGDEITINMGDETKVPAEIFESVAGKDVDVTFDLGDDLSWTVNGKDIPDDAALADLDLGVALDTDGIPANVVNAITGEVGTVQITLAHDGEFGFTMTLSAPLGEENAGYWANLYHYDEEAEKLNFEAAAEIDEDGNVKIPFTHASQYAIVIDDHSHATVPVSDIFINIAPDAWYKDAVQYAYDNGLMTGVSDAEFAPEATTTRAMIVSILARLENVTSAESAGFADVSADDWYATAVNWAASVGVVNGYEDNTFRPNTAITREQLAAMLMNYSAWKGEDVSARADLSTYSDAATISSWANDVMQWAVAEGLISGMTEDTLQPQGNATRAQVAAILQRFLDK